MHIWVNEGSANNGKMHFQTTDITRNEECAFLRKKGLSWPGDDLSLTVPSKVLICSLGKRCNSNK